MSFFVPKSHFEVFTSVLLTVNKVTSRAGVAGVHNNLCSYIYVSSFLMFCLNNKPYFAYENR